MLPVAILGATGYTARELLVRLLGHPHVKVTGLTTRSDDKPHLGDVHPVLRGRLDLHLENLAPQQIAARAQCAFSCLPHAASAEAVKPLLDAGLRVIDLSADYRLHDAAVYAQWYDHQHPDAARLAETPYGLPELYRARIRTAQLVANPGCYPTSSILPLAPLLKHKIIAAQGIVIDSKSGVSGAGRTPKANLHFPEANENFSAYAVGSHRHMPEIDQILSEAAGAKIETLFTPHLVPMDRGILTTTYSQPVGQLSTSDVLDALKSFYRDEPFVRVVDGLSTVKDVVGTNYCDLTARVVRGRVITISVLDNLVKGASGAAIQNMNIMYDFPETTAL